MSPQANNFVRVALQHTMTLLVFGALFGLAYFGHHTGWKLPKLAALWKAEPAKADSDWCDEHNVPESKCIACHPELLGGNVNDWCKEHGMPESKDPLCHPEILTGKVSADWCKSHGVPESQCTLCNPGVAVKKPASESRPPVRVSTAPGVKPVRNPLTCQTHLLRVQFASAEAVRKTGIEVEPVARRPVAATIEAPGEVDYDQTRLARLSSRTPGIVWKVVKELGQHVKAGDVLALIDAAEVGRAKSEFLQALAQVEVKAKAFARVRAVANEGFRSQADLQEATAAEREAKIRLFTAQQSLVNLGLPIRIEDAVGLPESKLAERMRLLGLPDTIRRSLDPLATTANLLPVTASLDGVIVAREAVSGEVVDPSKVLFTVADTGRMWVHLDVRSEDVPSVALGRPVVFRPDGAAEDAVAGKVTWISTAVDEVTRTVKVRAEVENPEGHLRARTYGTGRIVLRSTPDAIAVPESAVHWEGCCHVVFVRLTDEVFQTRKVRLGPREAGFVEILVGVLPGEAIATAGSHVLKSEILKSQMGAGCVDD